MTVPDRLSELRLRVAVKTFAAMQLLSVDACVSLSAASDVY